MSLQPAPDIEVKILANIKAKFHLRKIYSFLRAFSPLSGKNTSYERLAQGGGLDRDGAFASIGL